MATKNLTVRIRCTEREKADWQHAAGGERAFSDWARRTLNGASQQREAEALYTEPEKKIEVHVKRDWSGFTESGKKNYEPDFK